MSSLDSEYMSLEEQRARYEAAQERIHKAAEKRIETDTARAELQEELTAAKAKMQQQQELIDIRRKKLEAIQRAKEEEAQRIINGKRLKKERELDQVNADALNNIERLNHIMRLVAFVTDMTVDDLLSDRRDNACVKARHIAIWLAIQYTTCSLSRVARRFNRDHTTVLYAKRKLDIVLSHIGWPDASMKVEAMHLWESSWPSVSKEAVTRKQPT